MVLEVEARADVRFVAERPFRLGQLSVLFGSGEAIRAPPDQCLLCANSGHYPTPGVLPTNSEPLLPQ